MTGPEIAGAAMAAGKGLEKVLKPSSKERDLLIELARETPEAQLAAAKFSQRMLIKQSVITTLFEKLAKLVGVSQQYFQEDFAADLADRTADIPDDKLVAPPAAVAVPAMQALGYSLDEPDLKGMYLNLLATASDARRPGEAHPAFADIIRQLSAAEARALPSVVTWTANFPLAEVRVRRESGHGTYRTNLTALVEFPQQRRLRAGETSLWLDNWARLGLGTISYETYAANNSLYAWCGEHPDYLEVISEHPTEEIFVKRGRFQVSEFGKAFARTLSIETRKDFSDLSERNPVLIPVVERQRPREDGETPLNLN